MSAQRTKPQEVQDLLGKDWDSARPLTVFLRAANLIVDRVVTCLRRKSLSLSAEEAKLMECAVAAELYTKSDPTLASESTLGASGAYNRKEGAYLDVATALDPSSSCLVAAMKGQRATGAWLGRAPSAQTDFADRN